MATRERQAEAATDKAARAAALKVLDGQPLPLPTEPHDQPPEPGHETAEEVLALAAVGLTETQIANHFAMTLEELKAMSEGCQAVKRSLSRARTAAQAWWEEQSRRAVVTENNRFPAGMWSTAMRRFPDYQEKGGINLHFDLSSLVTISRRQPEPLGERGADGAKPLIEGHAVELPMSPTASGSVDPDLSGVDGGPVHHQGADPGPGGG